MGIGSLRSHDSLKLDPCGERSELRGGPCTRPGSGRGTAGSRRPATDGDPPLGGTLHPVRKQYHFWPSAEGLMAWDVERLIALSKGLTPTALPLNSIREIDEVYWFDDVKQRPTCRKVLEHMRLIHEVDLSYPIILGVDGRVMDGMHRVAKALLQGDEVIAAVQFEREPEPDYLGRRPEDLPY